ncbi:MAG TPA: AAA family ATPase [Trebonia sp.]|nr:AAA family ATPase [Trebonia sp.]
MSRLVYVSGRIGAGKTSLATPLAAALGYSLVIKDELKETLHDAVCGAGGGEPDPVLSQRVAVAAWELLFAVAARAGDMVIEANFHPHSAVERGKLLGLGGSLVEVHCECPAEIALARYNARSRHAAHTTTMPLSAMDKYDKPVGAGSLVTVDTTKPVDVAAVAADVLAALDHGVKR